MNFWNFVRCIVLPIWQLCFEKLRHTRTHTHTREHSHRLKVCYFLERSRSEIKYSSNYDNPGPRNSIQAKFKFFNGNINSKKDPGQIERNKLTYLHYLNKMIEKYKMTKFIFHEFSCFYSELFQRLCLDFKWLQLSLSIQWTPFADNSRPKATIKNLSEILEN